MIEDIILDGIKQRRIVEITYRDSKGATSRRATEPYEIKGDKYFGYCTLKNGIRAFKLGSILDAKIIDKSYTPRWNTL